MLCLKLAETPAQGRGDIGAVYLFGTGTKANQEKMGNDSSPVLSRPSLQCGFVALFSNTTEVSTPALLIPAPFNCVANESRDMDRQCVAAVFTSERVYARIGLNFLIICSQNVKSHLRRCMRAYSIK